MVNKILVISIIIFLPLIVGAQSCRWVNQNSCPEIAPIISDIRECTETHASQGLCCCSEEGNSPSPKFLLISSIIGFFAILTAVILFYKKNE